MQHTEYCSTNRLGACLPDHREANPHRAGPTHEFPTPHPTRLVCIYWWGTSHIILRLVQFILGPPEVTTPTTAIGIIVVVVAHISRPSLIIIISIGISRCLQTSISLPTQTAPKVARSSGGPAVERRRAGCRARIFKGAAFYQEGAGLVLMLVGVDVRIKLSANTNRQAPEHPIVSYTSYHANTSYHASRFDLNERTFVVYAADNGEWLGWAQRPKRAIESFVSVRFDCCLLQHSVLLSAL